MMCVCDKLNWMENGWMDWIEWIEESGCGLSGCGCGKWRGSGSHTMNTAYINCSIINSQERLQNGAQ